MNTKLKNSLVVGGWILTTTTIALTFLAISIARAQEIRLPDPVTIKVSRTTLQTIGQGLMELPYKTSAPILNDLQAQLNTADKAAVDAAKPPAPAEKPAETGTSPAEGPAAKQP